MRQRGPDQSGLVQAHGMTMGHARLAIIDLSERAGQPFESADGRYLMVFNGEIYNYKDLRESLGDLPLRTTSDTEVLLWAWQRWGERALERLVGPFAFGVFDKLEKKLTVVRDRFGEKPLFYWRDGSNLVFASTIHALLAHEDVSRAIAPERLFELVETRYVISPATILQDVKKLPPGSLLTFDGDHLEIRRWWKPPLSDGASPQVSGRERAERFDELFRQACRRCLESDRECALLLSDGIDSQSILHVLRDEQLSVPAIRFVPRYKKRKKLIGIRRGTRDMQGASLVEFGPHAAFENYEVALSALNEPVGDGAALATWAMIRDARDRGTVFLCGHGGDEVLGGYRLSQDRFRIAALAYLAYIPGAVIDGVIERHVFGGASVRDKRLQLRSARPDMRPVVAHYMTHRPTTQADMLALSAGSWQKNDSLREIRRLYEAQGAMACDLDRMQGVLIESFLSENVLVYADSASMANSAELRMPYLDRDLAEFVLASSPWERVSALPGRSNTKRHLRVWSRGHVPARIRRRGKRSFNYGTARRLLQHSGSHLQDRILSSAPLRHYLPGLEAWVRQGPSSIRGPREGLFWTLLAIAVWGENVGMTS